MGKSAEWFRQYRNSRKNTPHGTDNGYVNYGCRCRKCRTAHAERRRRDREQ